MKEKEFKDDSTLGEIIRHYKLLKGINTSFHKILISLLLIRKGEKKCSIGLDFTFTSFKNVRKVEFSAQSPSYREANDGMNIFCYCKNKDCLIYDQMFVKSIGYGRFDIVYEIKAIKFSLYLQ